jgi:PEGA domain
MGRTILSAIVASICLVPHLSEAQGAPGSAATPRATPGAPRGGSFGATIRQNPPQSPSRPTLPPSRPTLPPTRPTLPPGVPLVPPAPPSALDSVDLFRAGPRTYAPRYDRQRRFLGYGQGYGYITDPFGYISQPYAPVDDSAPRETEGTGYLRLDVEPDTARVYVDGLYVGLVSDFRRAPREFDAGPHRVEIRADGFESQSVDVSIRANDTLSYRGTLTRNEQRAALPPAAPKTFYVIPRCYAGDTRPRADQLPAGCRVGNLRTIPPVVAPSPR